MAFRRTDHRRAIGLGILSIGCAIVMLVGLPAGALEARWILGSAPGGASVPRTLTITPAGALNSNYPMYLYDDARASVIGGQPSLNLSAPPTVVWKETLPAAEAFSSQAIVDNGTVFINGYSGHEYALSESTGAVLWSTYIGIDTQDPGCGVHPMGPISTAAFDDGVIYVLGGGGDAYALNAGTGAIVWNTSLGAPISNGTFLWSSPLVHGSSVYAGISSLCDEPLVPAGLARLSTATGQVEAYFNTSQPYPNGSSIWSSPTWDAQQDAVVVTTGNPYSTQVNPYGESVTELSAAKLDVVANWSVPLSVRHIDSDFGATPTPFELPNGTWAVGAENKNGYFYALTESGLDLLWQDHLCTCGQNHYTATYAQDKLFVAGNGFKKGGTTYNTSFQALDPSTGAILWRDGFAGSMLTQYGAPLYIGGDLIISIGANLYFVKASSGAVLYTLPLGEEEIGPPSEAGGDVFLAEGDNVEALQLSFN